MQHVRLHVRLLSLQAQPRPGMTTLTQRWYWHLRCCETAMASWECGMVLSLNSKGGFSGCHCVPKKGRRWCSIVDTYSTPFLHAQALPSQPIEHCQPHYHPGTAGAQYLASSSLCNPCAPLSDVSGWC